MSKYRIRVTHSYGTREHPADGYAITDVGGPVLSIYENVGDSMPVAAYAPGAWFDVELVPDGLLPADLARMPEGAKVADHAGDVWVKSQGEWVYSDDKHELTFVVATDLVGTYGPIREVAPDEA